MLNSFLGIGRVGSDAEVTMTRNGDPMARFSIAIDKIHRKGQTPDPDWIRFTNELAEAGRASYKASQTRNQETVSKVTEQLNNSCSDCHRVYRGRTRCVKP